MRLAGSLAVSENGHFFNRMLFVYPSGECARYDKRHLFAPGGEADEYTPGDRRVVVTYRGVRFLLLVCYDLRFPVWSRSRDDYDAILCCASWPASRRDVWRTLLRARAIENQCFVAGANRTGRDPCRSIRAIRCCSTAAAGHLPRRGLIPRRSSRRSTSGRSAFSARNSPPGAMPTTSACFSDCASLFFPAESRIFTR